MENQEKTEEVVKLAKAKEEIEQVLSKYKVALIPVVIHQGDKTISRIDIAPIILSKEDSNS
jgi:DNA-binding protein YbaB